MSICFQKSTLFDSENELEEESKSENIINTNNSYANTYNDWRRKEELQKLKDKYGDSLDIMSEIENDSSDDNSDSESEESDIESLSEDPFDENFFTVYSALKNKDPKIYDKNYKFYDEDNEDKEIQIKSKKSEKEDSKKNKKFTLQEYHKKLIEEKKGITEEDESMLNQNKKEDGGKSYYEELSSIKKNIKDILKEDDDDDSDNDLFSVKYNTENYSNSENNVKQNDKKKKIPNIWANDNELDEKEKFLKHYILNKAYSNNPNELENDLSKYKNVANHFKNLESNENNEENFEAKTQRNLDVSKYHYEEPDATIIKRYPRNINSIRDMGKKDKKTKRAEIKARKKLEKEQELKRLRRLKREEIENKINTLKSVSGNEHFDFKDLDLNVIIDDENDFDAEKYDQKMQLLFGDEYYNKTSDQTKPIFDYIPEIDDEFHEETNLKIKKNNKKEIKKRRDIMADDDIGLYDDLIGGEIATRFRYRMVEPNGFGLTDEEILYADDKELNRWCSLKKMSQYRSKEQEIYDQKVYNQKSKNIALKRKIFKSLYETNDSLPDDNSDIKDSMIHDDDLKGNNEGDAGQTVIKKKRRKRKRNKSKNNQSKNGDKEISVKSSHINHKKSKKRRTKKNNSTNNERMEEISGISIQRFKAYGISNREFKKIKNK